MSNDFPNHAVCQPSKVCLPPFGRLWPLPKWHHGYSSSKVLLLGLSPCVMCCCFLLTEPSFTG